MKRYCGHLPPNSHSPGSPLFGADVLCGPAAHTEYLDQVFGRLENCDTATIWRKVPFVVQVGLGVDIGSYKFTAATRPVKCSEDELLAILSRLRDSTQDRWRSRAVWLCVGLFGHHQPGRAFRQRHRHQSVSPRGGAALRQGTVKQGLPIGTRTDSSQQKTLRDMGHPFPWYLKNPKYTRIQGSSARV
jgi:hypothetical protein